MEPGRNRPCPCGSGRKYKNCCMDRSVERREETARLLRAAQGRVEPQLALFAAASRGPKVLEKAWKEFVLGHGEVDPEGPEIQLFHPWLLYEWRPRRLRRGGGGLGSATLAETFLDLEGDRLGEREKEFVRAAAGATAFHEVLSVEPGRTLVLRDVLLGTEENVVEKSGSATLRPGDVIFARLARFEGFSLMVGAGSIPLPPTEKAPLLALRKRLREAHGEVTPEALAPLAKDLRRIYLEARRRLLSPRPPELRNTDGDPILFHSIHYRTASAELAFEALKSLAETRSEEDLLAEAVRDAEGRLESVEFPWLGRGNAVHENWENTILGRLVLEKDRLRIEVNSAARAGRIQREVERRLGTHCSYLKTEVESVEAATERAERERRTKKGREEARRDAEFQALPEVRAVSEAFIRSHMESWPTHQIPALGGRTPLEAVQDPEGREMVEALLLEFERKDRERLGPQPAFDYNIVRRRLGLPPSAS